MRWRLLLSFVLIILVTLIVLGLSIQSNTQSAITTFAQKGGFVGADRIVTQLENYYADAQTWDGVEDLLSTSGLIPGRGGRFGQGGGTGQNNIMISFAVSDTTGNLVLNQNMELTSPLPQNILENAIPIHHNDDIVGYLIPENSILDLSDIVSQDLSQALNNSLLITALVSGGVALLLALVMAYFILRPVRQLTLAARKLAQGDLSQRVNISTKDELGQMAATFNIMAASLERAESSRKAMTADIAHELRTPLSVQRANLEAILDGVYPLSMDSLSPIIEQNQLLNRLVEDLRTLALTDSNDLVLESKPHDLVEIAGRIVDNFRSKFDRKEIQVEFSHPENIPYIYFDERRFTQIINNLLQNAYQHTPQGGLIKVKIDANIKWVTLSVQDSGEGIPEEALPLIFERFYRADQSRTRDKGGSGLGLTIARRLAEAHSGTLTAENAASGGAIFTLSLPVR